MSNSKFLYQSSSKYKPTRNAFDVIMGNNGTFGNSGNGAGGFDMDIPQIDKFDKGGTSFFDQKRKEQTRFDTIYGTLTPSAVASQKTSIIPNESTESNREFLNNYLKNN